MSYEEMGTELDRLQGLPFPPPDYQTHWLGLQDLPRPALAFAVGRAARACDRFPTPAELRALADTKATAGPLFEDQSAPLDTPVAIVVPFRAEPIQVTREWKYYCEDCSDTGWFTVWCGDDRVRERTRPWMFALACPRALEHAPHEWVKKCACWHSNPALVKRREEQARYAEQRAGQGRR